MKTIVDKFEIQIDRCELWRLKKYKYYHFHNNHKKKIYFQRQKMIKNKRYNFILHREIMNCPKGMFVDHISGDAFDNRKCNLRICTNSENIINSDKPKNNTSGYKGVYRYKNYKTWFSLIGINNKRIYLGSFKTKEEAYKAYCSAAKKYHGSFARLEK